MARKGSLMSGAIGMGTMYKNAAAQSHTMQREFNEMEVDDIPEQYRKKIIYLDDSMLKDDPMNEEINGPLDMEEVNSLAEAIREFGFRGVILAYRVGDKYQIESGHRRRAAARIAGMEKIPVYPTDPPKTQWERRMRLHLGNLHSRKQSPMRTARIAQDLFETYKEVLKQRKEKGIFEKGEITSANKFAAQQLDMDEKSIEKYRALTKLIPCLQEMADSGEYSWSALSAASTLSEDKQQELANMIIKKTDTGGSADRSWIMKAIAQLKNNAKEKKEPRNRQNRTKNTVKQIVQYSSTLISSLEASTVMNSEEAKEMIGSLENLKSVIDKKLEEIKKVPQE